MKTHQKILIIVALVSFFSCFVVMLSRSITRQDERVQEGVSPLTNENLPDGSRGKEGFDNIQED